MHSLIRGRDRSRCPKKIGSAILSIFSKDNSILNQEENDIF